MQSYAMTNFYFIGLEEIDVVNVLSPSEKPVTQLGSKGSSDGVNLGLSITTT
jgi:hypothetical protein